MQKPQFNVKNMEMYFQEGEFFIFSKGCIR